MVPSVLIPFYQFVNQLTKTMCFIQYFYTINNRMRRSSVRRLAVKQARHPTELTSDEETGEESRRMVTGECMMD